MNRARLEPRRPSIRVWSRASTIARLLLVSVTASVPLCGAVRGQCQRWGDEFAAGPSAGVYALATFDDLYGTELYVGGYFGSITNGPNVNGIARWDGQTWRGLGYGFNDEVRAFHVFDDGNGPALYVGGAFTAFANGTPAYFVVRWDGIGWSTLAPGLAGGFGGVGASVYSFATFDDGSGPALYAGGYLPYSNGTTLNGIAKWTGTQWASVGGGLPPDGSAYAMTVFDDGGGPALFVGGYFSSAGGHPASGLAKWDGSTWTPIGLGAIQIVNALQVWDDGSGPALYMGTGTAQLTGGGSTFGIVRWDGAAWSAVGGGTSATVFSFAVHDDGRGEALYAGGDLTQAGGIPVNHIARWDGQQWSALGGGLPGQISPVKALLPLRLGPGTRPDLYAGGYFGWAADLPSLHVARWISCEDPIDSFCPGDGSYASCPCLRYSQGPPNNGVPGHGCDNSQFTGGALLQANGSPVPDSIVLRATGELPTALTIFLQGNQVLTAPTPFGDGLRCIGGSLKRLYTKSAAAGTVSAPQGPELSVTARSAALGDPIAPGSLRYYQTYYRDPNPNLPVCVAPLGSTFNSSNGVRIVW